MFVKIVTIVLLASIAVSKGDTEWDGLVASWSLGEPTHFYSLPKTQSAAEAEGWYFISGVEQSEEITPLGYQGDPRLVLLFCQDKVVGYQVGLPVADFENAGLPMDWGELDDIITKELNGVWYYTGTAFFSNGEETGTPELWLQKKSGLVQIPTNTSLVSSKTEFVKKVCVPTMGGHYYGWDSEVACTTMTPWFLLADGAGDSIIGAGFQGMGSASSADSRTWWEAVGTAELKVVYPDVPECVVKAFDKFRATSVHVWFVANPQTIRCS